jgi:glycosyltransferase involved in cell wall biosynthesis
MAICRVYLSTYRRHDLLPRALRSLLEQTFEDWTCELHNDDPTDLFPTRLAEEVGDSRVRVINHPYNYGPTKTINLFFKCVDEPFFSILEDDNWWEPEFLDKMLTTMEAFPDVQIAWANMRLWRQEIDGNWTDTGRNVWDRSPSAVPELFSWPDRRQLMGALHSQGAMLARGGFKYFSVPEDTTSAAMEPFRERTFKHPILFVPRRLANFAITMEHSRSKRAEHWAHALVILSGTFLTHVAVNEDTLAEIWLDARLGPAKSTAVLFVTAFTFPKCRKILKYALVSDWMFVIAYSLRHPLRFLKTIHLVLSAKNQVDFLDQHTSARARESECQAVSAS